MAFMDYLFPVTIAEGIQGGRSWQTPMVVNRGGHRKVNEDWSEPLGEWTLEQRNRTTAETQALQGFFHAVAKGRANSFRLLDPLDSYCNNVTATRLTDTTFQIRQRYRFTWRNQTVNYFLNVTKPMPNDHEAIVRVGENPVTDYTISSTTGIVTLGTAAPSNVSVRISTMYHIEAFLMNERFAPIYDTAGFYTWPDIIIREHRT